MASDAGQLYYCHQCARAVRPTALICPNCHGDFLEEWPGAVPLPSAAHPAAMEWALMAPGFGQLLEDMSSFLTRMHMVQIADGGAGFAVRSGNIDPMLVLRDRVQNLLSMHNRELPYDLGASVLPHRMSGRIGDYFVGPGFEQLLQQLAENDPSRHGAPPASKSAVEALPTISISKEHLGTDSSHCAVCKDEFELRTKVKQMPCKHLYHPDCILPWLSRHNSCPVCRYELPTDDPDYQGFSTGSSSARTGARASGMGSDGREPAGFSFQGTPRQFFLGRHPRAGYVTTQQLEHQPSPGNNGRVREGSQGTGGRRFSITLPWFRGFMTTFASPASGHTSTDGNDNVSNSGALGDRYNDRWG